MSLTGKCGVLAAGLGLALFVTPARALVINGGTATNNDRFTNLTTSPTNPTANPSFFASSYDLSGIGWNYHASTYVGVALISNQYFVAANHFKPTGTIYFQGSDGVTRSYTVDSYTNYTTNPSGDTADFVIGKLTSTVDAHIASYAIADGTQQQFLGLNIIPFGQNQQAGLNQIDGIGTVHTNNDPNNTYAIYYDYDTVNGFNPGEAHVISGDSGSPTFTVVNGNLVLVGAHFALDGNTNTTYDSLAAGYYNQIASGVGARLQVVPEPGMLGAAGLLLVMLKRKPRRAI